MTDPNPAQTPGFAKTDAEIKETANRFPTSLPADILRKGSGGQVVQKGPDLSKVETFQVTLPSKGLLYGKQLPDGVITCRLPTTREEAILAGPGDAATKMSNLIDGLIVKCGDVPNPKMLLVTDRFFVLMAVRIRCFGLDYVIQYRCSSCGTQQKHKLNLQADLSQRQIEVPDEEIVEPFLVTLPTTGQVVGFRLMRGIDELEVARYAAVARMRGKALAGEDPSYVYALARSIVTIDGEELSQERKEMLVRSWTWRDTNTLNKARQKVESGIDTRVFPSCGSCGYINEMEMPFSAEFWLRGMHSLEEVQEQVFFLTEYSSGLTYEGVMDMSVAERLWMVKRLIKKHDDQKKAHEEARREAETKAKSRSRSKRR